MQEQLCFGDILGKGMAVLEQAGITCFNIDAWYLLEYVTGMGRAEYFLRKNNTAPLEVIEKYFCLIDERATHKPLQYITGSQEFMGFTFKVSKDVLVPRQDTETLVEYVLPFVNKKQVLDLCTGSGCIAISLAKLGTLVSCTAADYSEKALGIARQNARLNNVNINFIQSDMFKNITGRYDIIVSNPPYIETGVIDTLMPEVRDYEPREALDGGSDGLLFYRIISRQAKDYLNPEGMLAVETGACQGQDVMVMFKESGYKNVCIQKDLSGNDRVVAAVMP